MYNLLKTVSPVKVESRKLKLCYVNYNVKILMDVPYGLFAMRDH